MMMMIAAAEMVVVKEEIRKGPWTEQEDIQLVCYVRKFGERRWDYLAKVSGLNRTGKSCRLRWVNYLHPGLKHGRMTPHEERLILELHSRWGNRWARIARKLPGRTDNEIKNYWRTHMRKQAQDRKRNVSPSSSSTSSNYVWPLCNEALAETETEKFNWSKEERSSLNKEDTNGNYTLDQIWKEMTPSETVSGLSFEDSKTEVCDISYPLMASPVWEYYSDTLWKVDDEEIRMFPPMGGPPVSEMPQ